MGHGLGGCGGGWGGGEEWLHVGRVGGAGVVVTLSESREASPVRKSDIADLTPRGHTEPVCLGGGHPTLIVSGGEGPTLIVPQAGSLCPYLPAVVDDEQSWRNASCVQAT